MVIANQDGPAIAGFPVALRPPRSTASHFRADLRPSKGIGTSVHRVSQNSQDRVVQGKLPIDLVVRVSIPNGRQGDPFFATPKQYLSGAAEFLKFSEDHMNGILYA